MGLLKDQWLCENCRVAMCLVYRDGSDGEALPCSICGVKCSIRKGSLFEKPRLKLSTLTKVLYCYGIDLQV